MRWRHDDYIVEDGFEPFPPDDMRNNITRVEKECWLATSTIGCEYEWAMAKCFAVYADRTKLKPIKNDAKTWVELVQKRKFLQEQHIRRLRNG